MGKKFKKIFISHHNTDAPKLSVLKFGLKSMGFQCFLAHEDIDPGEHDLTRIEKELKECDVFIYIGGKKANESAFCQQEIGMAFGLEKTMITTMTGGVVPEGFVGRIQAINYKDIDDDFYNKIYAQILKIFPLPKSIKSHHNVLNINGFSQNRQKNSAFLDWHNWDDYGYKTTFELEIDGRNIGVVKIAHTEQIYREHTSEKLPNYFTHLSMPFFSRLKFDENSSELNTKQIHSLRVLLNDVTIMPDDELKLVSDKEVYEVSLYR